MAKSRSSKPKSKSKSSRKSTREKSLLNSTGSFSTNPHAASTSKAADLLAEASTLLHERSSASAALPLVTAHLSINPDSPPALDLLGEIHIELGDTAAAFSAFSKSASLDPDGNPEPAGSGPEKFLWLAQLSSAGAAVSYYEQGITIIKRWLAATTTNAATTPPPAAAADDRRLESKLVSALCGLAEIYMSDLCMEPDAESRCERYVTEALLALPESAEALQTLASVRISQQRVGDAVAALERAFESWRGLESGDARIPPYADRVNLSKLLIETARYETALEVLEVLQMEDDQLPDLWYLGGWCLFLLGEGEKERGGGEWEESWESAKEWLGNCLTLYDALEWEDEGIRDHARELMERIATELPEEMDAGEGDEGGGGEEEEEWEDEVSSDDQMEDR